MKNFQIKYLTGLLLFTFNISLVVIAVVKNDDLYVAYAILLSCIQFYLYDRFKISRIFFESDVPAHAQAVKYRDEHKTHLKYYDVNPN